MSDESFPPKTPDDPTEPQLIGDEPARVVSSPTVETEPEIPIEGNFAIRALGHFRRWKKSLQNELQLISKMDSARRKQYLLRKVQSIDLQNLLARLTKTLQKGNTTFYINLAAVTLSLFFLADLTGLLAERLIPDPISRGAPRGSYSGGALRNKTVQSYNSIPTRNLFNSQGLIPGEESAGAGQGGDPGGAPIKSSLPFNLIGIMILTDEAKSIATIEDKAASAIYPMQAEDEIPNKIKVIKVEPRRVTFINRSTNRREYLELPEDPQAKNPILNASKPMASGAPIGGGVEKVAGTQYNVSRSEIDKALGDLNNILTQARAVPNFENGIASGYKLFQIVPGSIYDKLGLQNGDVISGLNNTPINDPGKAFEMINELKTANHLELQVKKDGKQQNYIYDIR